jgi:ubiquinone/menaquinone biosynthesis C-methylase UbiE
MIAGSRQGAADYYRTLTSLYRWYGGAAHGWHYGIYDEDVSSHRAALLRCNEVLLEGIPTNARVMDVGCGDGGFAAWAARLGYRVIGITVCAEHVALAKSLVESYGVADRCCFLVMDMNALGFSDHSVDIVVNQETWCHAQSKASYIESVKRVLRPNGQFRSVDLSLGRVPANRFEQRQYEAVLKGFEVPALVSAAQIARFLQASGFEGVTITDLTRKVRRTSTLIFAFSLGPHLLTMLGLDRLLYGREASIRRAYRGHVAACVAFNLGLQRGLFRYLSVSARKRR